MPEERGDAKFLSQLKALREAFGVDVELTVGYSEEGAPNSVYFADSILTRRSRLGEVRRLLPDSPDDPDALGDVIRVPLGGRKTYEMRADLEPLIRSGAASYEHIISIAPVGCCPAHEPLPVSLPGGPALPAHLVRPLNPVPSAEQDLGVGVKVLVVDTGLVPDFGTHPWISDVIGDLRSFTPGSDPIPEYAGHGTFIAGVLRAVAPGVELHVSGHLRHAGGISEFDLGQILVQTLEADGWPDIISLSAGSNSDFDQPLAGLEHFVSLLAQHPKTVLVAAAGNHGSRRPFWPAALAGPFPSAVPGVVSVGALRETGDGLACFSNFGPWVSVHAPGERLVNAFTSGDYTYRDPASDHCRYYPPPPFEPGCTCLTAPAQGSPATFTGLASWSGTSFATPIVAAMIAARMSQTDECSRDAAAALIASAPVLPCVGPMLVPPTWTPGG